MSDFTDLERRLGGALDRMRAAYTGQAAGRQRAEARLQEVEAELLQARDAVAAAQTTPDPAPDPAVTAELEAARSHAETAVQAREEAEMRLAALQSDLEAVQAEAETLRSGLAEAKSRADTAPEAGGDAEALRTVEAERDEARAEAAKLRDKLAAQNGSGRLAAVQAADDAEAAQARVTELEASLSAIRQVNAQLRQNNAALREAHTAGLPDAGLINEGLQAELDALRAARNADRAEIDSVLSALAPLLKGDHANA